MWFLLDSPDVWRGRAHTEAPARTLALAEHCRRAGADVLLALCDRGADYGTAADWPIPVTRLHHTDFYNPGVLARHLQPPLHADDRHGAHSPGFIVSSEANSLVSVARPAAAMLGAHLIYDTHDALTISPSEPRDSANRRAATQRAALRCADTVLTLGRREHAAVLVSGVQPSRVLLLPNGTAPGTLPHGPSVHSGLVAFVGDLFHEPNAQAVKTIRDRMLPHLSASGIDARVKVIGRGPARLTNPVRSGPSQAASQIEFAGPVDSVHDALCGAALALAPLGTGAKMKVLDYLAAGIPVLSTSEAVAGLGHDHPGVVVEDDLDLWPAQITALLRDPARLLRLGAEGRTYVLNDLTWASVGARLVGYCHARVKMTDGPGRNLGSELTGLRSSRTALPVQESPGASVLTGPKRHHHIRRNASPQQRLLPHSQAVVARRAPRRPPTFAGQRAEG